MINRKQSILVFKVSDYDLDWNERKEKFKDYDLILCEKCNKRFDVSRYYYCRDCYRREIDDTEKERIKCGKCKECLQVKSYNNWCLYCNPKHFQQNFVKWTSGNKDIDKLIQDIQLSAEYQTQVLEWIPYNRFSDIKFIAEGGFARVYSAIWVDGRIIKWDQKFNNWARG